MNHQPHKPDFNAHAQNLDGKSELPQSQKRKSFKKSKWLKPLAGALVLVLLGVFYSQLQQVSQLLQGNQLFLTPPSGPHPSANIIPPAMPGGFNRFLKNRNFQDTSSTAFPRITTQTWNNGRPHLAIMTHSNGQRLVNVNSALTSKWNYTPEVNLISPAADFRETGPAGGSHANSANFVGVTSKVNTAQGSRLVQYIRVSRQSDSLDQSGKKSGYKLMGMMRGTGGSCEVSFMRMHAQGTAPTSVWEPEAKVTAITAPTANSRWEPFTLTINQQNPGYEYDHFLGVELLSSTNNACNYDELYVIQSEDQNGVAENATHISNYQNYLVAVSTELNRFLTNPPPSLDNTNPAAINNLSASSPTENSVNLSWQAPGDDGSIGTAATYDVRYRIGNTFTESNWASATQAGGEPIPQAAGTTQGMFVNGLLPSTNYAFALKTRDEVGNESSISNTATTTTTAPSGTTGGPPPVGPISAGAATVEINAGALTALTTAPLQSVRDPLLVDPDWADVYNWKRNGVSTTVLNITMNAGAVIADFSGHNNHGTVVGNPQYTNSINSCNTKGCLSFDGNGDYIQLPENDADFDFTLPFSIMAWASRVPGPSGGTGPIISKYDLTGNNQNNRSWNMEITLDGKLKVETFCSTGTYTETTIATDFTFNSMHITTAVIKSNGDISIYIRDDERPTTTSGTPCTTLNTNNTPVRIGAKKEAAGFQFLTGHVDGVRLYPQELTPEFISRSYSEGNTTDGGPRTMVSQETRSGETYQVQLNYVHENGTVINGAHLSNTIAIEAPTLENIILTLNNGSPTAGDLVTISATRNPFPSDRIGVYSWRKNREELAELNIPFNLGSTQHNFGANSAHFTTQGDAHYETSGRTGGSIALDGTGDFLTANPDINPGEDNFTWSMWVKTAQIGTNHALMSNWNVVGGTDAIVMVVGASSFGCHNIVGAEAEGKAGFVLRDERNVFCVYSNTSVNNNRYHHLAGVKTGDSAAIYVDGVLENTINGMSGIDFSPPGTDFTIGGIAGGAWTTEAMIDEVQVYESALSADQIRSIHSTAGAGAPRNITAQDTSPGDTYQLTLSYVHDDGTLIAGEHTSNTITVDPNFGLLRSGDITLNSPTEFTSIIAIPDPTINLSSNTVTYSWKKEGDPYASLIMPFNSGRTQSDLSSRSSTFNITPISQLPVNTRPTFRADCRVGVCYRYDGTDDLLNFGNILNPGSESYSVSVWFKANASTNSKIIAAKGNSTATTAGWSMGIEGSTNKLIIRANSGGGNTLRASQRSGNTVGTEWNHAVMVIDRTQNKIIGYLNGSNIGWTAGGGGISTDSLSNFNSISTADHLMLGFVQGGSESLHFDGHIDEFMIFPRVLSAEQINKIFINRDLSEIVPEEHELNQDWLLTATEITAGGDKKTSFPVGQVTIAPGPPSVITINAQAAQPASDAVTITYSCSNSLTPPPVDIRDRDIAITYSTDGGLNFNAANISNTSTGTTIVGNTIQNVRCNGLTGRSFTWDTVADGVGAGTLQNVTLKMEATDGGVGVNTFSVENAQQINSSGILPAGTGGDLICDGTQQPSPITITMNGRNTYSNITLRKCILTHSVNPSAPLEITVSGNMSIDAESKINLNSKGSRGGNRSGNRSANGEGPGASTSLASRYTAYAGASHGGMGGSADHGRIGDAYGDWFNPLKMGSGGAGGETLKDNRRSTTAMGGNGGGYIQLEVNGILSLNGEITANGGDGSSGNSFTKFSKMQAAGGGSGGGIKITTGELIGSGLITANGGKGAAKISGSSAGDGGNGGGGRVAVFYTTDNSSITYSAASGDGVGNKGGAGTIYLKDESTGRAPGQNGTLIIRNNNISPEFSEKSTTINESLQVAQLIIDQKATLMLMAPLQMRRGSSLFIQNGTLVLATDQQNQVQTVSLSSGIITNKSQSSSSNHHINITAENMSLDAASSINVSSKGGRGGNNNSGGGPPGETRGRGLRAIGDHNIASGGGGYGGAGTAGEGGRSNGTGGSSYGSFSNPNQIGSGGGGTGGRGGAGGGLIILSILDTLQIDGVINTDGENGNVGTDAITFQQPGGGGSGGTVNITTGTLTGSGTITANGGRGAHFRETAAGNGGGGRIAVFYNNDNSTITYSNKSGEGQGAKGGAGTIYKKDRTLGGTAEQNGIIILDAAGVHPESNSISSVFDSAITADTITIKNGAIATFQDTVTVTGINTLTIDGGTFISDTENQHIFTNINLINGGVFTSEPLKKANFTAMNLTIDTSSQIDVTGKGHAGGRGTTEAEGNGHGAGGGIWPNRTDFEEAAGGGAYGGKGGTGIGGRGNGAGGKVYGSIKNPIDYGSGGGGQGGIGGAGGGVVQIEVSGTITNNGSIMANGGDGSSTVFDKGPGGGSGGTVNITAGTYQGTGDIWATGGRGGVNSGANGGHGGGGRVSITASTLNIPSIGSGKVRLVSPNAGPSEIKGAGGTLFVRKAGEPDGILIVDNENLNRLDDPQSTFFTDLFNEPRTFDGFTVPANPNLEFQGIIVSNFGKLLAKNPPGTSLTLLGPVDPFFADLLAEFASSTQIPSQNGNFAYELNDGIFRLIPQSILVQTRTAATLTNTTIPLNQTVDFASLITWECTDPEEDLTDIKVEFSVNGDPFRAATIEKVDAADEGVFTQGAGQDTVMQGMSCAATTSSHQFEWNYGEDIPDFNNDQDVKIKLTAIGPAPNEILPSPTDESTIITIQFGVGTNISATTTPDTIDLRFNNRNRDSATIKANKETIINLGLPSERTSSNISIEGFIPQGFTFDPIQMKLQGTATTAAFCEFSIFYQGNRQKHASMRVVEDQRYSDANVDGSTTLQDLIQIIRDLKQVRPQLDLTQNRAGCIPFDHAP